MKKLMKSALLASAMTIGVTAAMGALTLAPQAASAQAKSAWPHLGSDVAADEAVRFGTLPNGMRYAIRRNATPPGNASLRLRIDAGSIDEAEDQRGLAHFLEHMTLNETRNVPEGELIKILERHGLKFGPDTNAFTSFEQTVYMLDLPKTDTETVDTALFLMREVAGEATLSKTAVDRERNVVLSEERTRATPNFRLAVNEFGYLFPGDKISQRMPIGLTDVIRTAPRERLVDFYEKYYRPERATLIAVGDFDVDQMEAKIKARFSNWRGKGQPGPSRPAAVLGDRKVATRVFVEPGVPHRVSLSWVAPLDERPDRRERRMERTREQLGLQILNRRIERMARGDQPPFIGGAVQRHRTGLRGEITQVIAVAQPGGWEKALAAIEQEQRRVALHGFSQAELDREISESRSQLVAAASGAATRPSAELANELIGTINEDRVFAAPQTRLALFDAAVQGLKAEQVTAATRRLFTGSGPLVYMTSPTPVENGDQVLLAAFDRSRAAGVAQAQAQQAVTWPYQSFGTPGQVVERREIEGTGATAVRFANGVRLTVKPTNFRDDEIITMVRFGQGVLGAPADRPNAIWGLGGGAFTGAGLGKLSEEELQQVLAGKVYSVAAGVGEDGFVLSGQTRPEDLAVQLQLLTAHIADPGWRPTGWNRLRSLAGTIHDQLQSSPSGVFGRDGEALLRAGDRRWATPTREEMSAMTIDELRALIGNFGPVELVIVGDVTVDEAVRQTAATFGALPPRPAAAAATAPMRFAKPGSVTLEHRGRPDQGLAMIAWPTAGLYPDRRTAEGLDLLSQVMQLRLNEEIRERQGAAYSPRAGHSPSSSVPDFGYLAVTIETPPAQIDGFFRDAAKIAADLAARPVSADELQRARGPFLESLQKQRTSSNQWWAAYLSGAQERPERAERIRNMVDQYRSFTPADLQALARRYLVAEKAFRVAVKPAATPAT